MKKIILTLHLLLFIAVGLTSCSDDAYDAEKVTQQTLLVYMPWTGNASSSNSGLYPYFLNNIDSMEAGIKAAKGLGTTRRVLVLLSKSATNSQLFEIKYENGSCTHHPIKDYTNLDFSSSAGITEVLNEVKTQAQALNYALVIGGHGTGWTMKEDWQNYPYNAKKRHVYGKTSDSAYPFRFTDTRFMGSVADPNYSINIPDIASAIAATGLKMQYILFDDCYMANAEVAYELRNVTNYLIASTSEVIIIGMPYASMWSNLSSATPGYSAIVSAFHNFYSKYTVPCGALSVINCREMETLAGIMKEINAGYTLDETLRDSIQVLDGFNQPIFYDMTSYVKNLKPSTSLLSKYTTQMGKVIKSTQSTETLYSNLYNSPVYITVKSYSGITISDPSNNTAALKSKEKTNWWKATH